jgi:hypothetical protein
MEKFKVVILVVAFVALSILLFYFFHTNNIYSNVQNATNMQVISHSSLPINQTNSNFAYSIWFYINDWSTNIDKNKIIFGRNGGVTTSSADCMTSDTRYSPAFQPCPMVFLNAYENDLGVSLTVFDSSNNPTTTNTFYANNVPLQKWVHTVISIYGRTLDIYLDGKLVSTNILDGAAKIFSTSDLYITPCGGFNGWTSKLQYFTTPLNPQQVWDIYKQGYGAGYLSNIMSQNQLTVTINKNGVPTSSFTV